MEYPLKVEARTWNRHLLAQGRWEDVSGQEHVQLEDLVFLEVTITARVWIMRPFQTSPALMYYLTV